MKIDAATYTIIGQYFKGKELAFAMGIRQSFSRLGSSLNDILTPILYENFHSVGITIWIGSFFLFVSILLTISLIFLENIHLHYAFKENKYLKTHFDKMKKLQSLTVLPQLTPLYGSVNTSSKIPRQIMGHDSSMNVKIASRETAINKDKNDNDNDNNDNYNNCNFNNSSNSNNTSIISLNCGNGCNINDSSCNLSCHNGHNTSNKNFNNRSSPSQQGTSLENYNYDFVMEDGSCCSVNKTTPVNQAISMTFNFTPITPVVDDDCNRPNTNNCGNENPIDDDKSNRNTNNNDSINRYNWQKNIENSNNKYNDSNNDNNKKKAGDITESDSLLPAIPLRNIERERERECISCFNCFSCCSCCHCCASCNDGNNRSKSPIEIIGSFPLSYWILTLCLVLMYGTVITWNDTAVSELYSKYNGLSYVASSNLLTIFWVIAAVFTPIFGLIADRIGHKCELIIISGILLSIAHIWIYLPFQTDPLIMILLLSLGFSMFPASVFPGIATVIHKRDLGTAYGLLTAAFNTALTIYPMIIANLIENDDDDKENGNRFEQAQLVFIALSLTSVVCGMVLYVDDVYYNNKKLTNSKYSSHGNDDCNNHRGNHDSNKCNNDNNGNAGHPTEQYWKNVISTPCGDV